MAKPPWRGSDGYRVTCIPTLCFGIEMKFSGISGGGGTKSSARCTYRFPLGRGRIGARRGYDIGNGEERRSRRDRGDGYIDGEDTEEEEADMLLLDPKFFSKVGRCIAYTYLIS